MAKLLLVEDDNNLREIYQARLSAEGYDIVTAQNGEEALSVAKQHRPDLIISDVMMPRISGFEMLDILRATPELASTKVIMLTALGQAEDQARAGKLGADKYLVKSQVTLEDIVNCARDLINGTTVVAPGAAQTNTTPSTDNVPKPISVGAPEPAQSAVPPVTEAADSDPVSSVIPTTAPLNSTPTPAPTDDTVIAAPTAVLPVADPATVQPIDPAVAQTVTPSTVTTVQDPDPIVQPTPPTVPLPTPAPTEIPQIVAHKSSMLSNPDIQPSNEAEKEQVDETTASTDAPPTATQMTQFANTPSLTAPLEQQTLAAEEANIESQIAAFANSSTGSIAPPSADDTAEAVTASNEAALNEAVQDLATAVNEPPVMALPPSQKPIPGGSEPPATTPEEPLSAAFPTPQENTVAEAPATPNTSDDTTAQLSQETTVAAATQTPPPGNTVTPAPSTDDSDQVAVAGKKVIRPINDITKGPNLDELLAKEVAKEEAASGVTSATVVSADAVDAAPPSQLVATAPAPSDDPNSIAL